MAEIPKEFLMEMLNHPLWKQVERALLSEFEPPKEFDPNPTLDPAVQEREWIYRSGRREGYRYALSLLAVTPDRESQ